MTQIAQVTVICSGCRSRYTVELDWLSSAAEFACSCGARLKPNTDGLFQVRHGLFEVRHGMAHRPEVTLRLFRLDEVPRATLNS